MSKLRHVESRLRKLKLSGVVDTLELRLDQAQKEHLGYQEFLGFLLQDEVERRSQRGLERRVRQARFEEVKTLAEVDFTYNPRIPAQRIRDLAACQGIHRESQGVHFPGDGHVHLAGNGVDNYVVIDTRSVNYPLTYVVTLMQYPIMEIV